MDHGSPAANEVVIIVNPRARKGLGHQVVSEAVQRLVTRGLQPDLVTGSNAHEATELAHHHARRGVRAVVAAGGDGMVRIVGQGVAGTATPFGLLPIGTGNDYARALGLATDPVEAADIIADGHVRPVDAGISDGQWWQTIACAGFDSRVSERANTMGWPRGHFRYDVATALELASMRTYRFRMIADGLETEFHALFVAIGNTHSYGGGMRICPDASPFDGLLSVTVVGPMSRPSFIRIMPKVKTSPSLTHPMIARFRARTVSLELAGSDLTDGHERRNPAELIAFADGDPIGPLPMTFAVVPGAIQLLCPRRDE